MNAKIIKSITPLIFLLNNYYYPNTVPYYHILNTYNLSLSGILFHTSIEYNSKYQDYFWYYDRLSISIMSSFLLFNNEFYAILYSLIILYIEIHKNRVYIKTSTNWLYILFNYLIILYIIINKSLFYILVYILVVQKCAYKINCILFITQVLGLYNYLNRNYRKWTIKQKITWHLSQFIYFFFAGNVFYI